MTSTESLKSFGERIKSLRLNQKKLSVAEAAKQLDVASANLNNWERGIAKPPLEVLVKLAVFYNVTVDYLVGYVPNDKTKAIMTIVNNLTDEQKEDALTILDILKKKGQ